VYLIADPEKNTLVDFRYRQHFRAEAGGNGGAQRMHGKAGRDLEIPVPPGTIVRTVEGELIADLDEPGKRILVARGGRGGLGNVHFATPTHRTPRVAQKGEPGEECWITLELRLIADVGIIGIPNAGKSTFLAATTRATPKIAAYPFTTLSPNLGVAMVGDRVLTLADIPGLIEGAHAGVGLGHEFLRHISRTKVLLHLLDGSAPDPVAAYQTVNAELALFDEALPKKPQVVAINKIDEAGVHDRLPDLHAALRALGVDPIDISAQTGEGVPEALGRIVMLLDAIATAEPVVAPVAEEAVVLRPQPARETFVVEKEAGGFRVIGRRIERIVAMTDFENEEGAAYFQRQLKKLGVSDALTRAGVQPGDVVRIGKIELEWSA
jgi:GTP-binding protein